MRFDIRWGAGDLGRIRKHAVELVALSPDVILAVGALTVGPLQQASTTVPIVFASVTDPVDAGFVASMARPSGNATGFTQFEYGFSGKWLELLKQVAPLLARAAVLRDSTLIASISQFAAIQSQAPSLGVELQPIDTRRVDEIERAIAAFAHTPNSGLIVVTGSSAIVHRDLIIGLAARHQLPAVPAACVCYQRRPDVLGPDNIDQYRRAAGYVDRIFKGENPPTCRCRRR